MFNLEKPATSSDHMAMGSERNAGSLRCEGREALNSFVRVLATDAEGFPLQLMGKCVNVSESGMRVELKDRLQTRSYVSFQIEKPRFEGTASVRSESRSRNGWQYGLEFSGGLRWKPSDGEA
jgi:hypothetical protein